MLKKSVFKVATTSLMLGASIALSTELHAANLPTVKRGIAKTVSIGSAGYGAATDHTGLNKTGVAPEIKALARALKHDPDLLYAYVKNRIEITPVFGLQKGALGAYIDGHGTAFDQAQLMLDLAKASVGQAGSIIQDAKLVYGTIQLNGTQVQEWLGVETEGALCRLLADGGIPTDFVADDTDCGTVGNTALGANSTYTMAHAWVELTLSGITGNRVYDPAFKRHVDYSGVNLKSLMGYTDGKIKTESKLTDGTSNLSADDDYQIPQVHSANTALIATELENRSAALLAQLKLDTNKDRTLAELVGGRDIISDLGVAGAPYGDLGNDGVDDTYDGYQLTASIVADDVPDQFRTTLNIAFDDGYAETNSTPVSVTVYADEVYGRRFEIEPAMTANHFKFPQVINDPNSYTLPALSAEQQTEIDGYCDQLLEEEDPADAPVLCDPNHTAAVKYKLEQIRQIQDLNFTAQLQLDGDPIVPFASDSAAADTATSYSGLNLANGRSGWGITLTVNHPYAAENGTYMDQVVSTQFDLVTTVNIVNGWGHTSGELMQKWSREYGQDTVYQARLSSYSRGGRCDTGCDPSDLTPQENTKAKVGASWLAQFSRMADLASSMQDAQVLHHHTVGLSYAETSVSEDCDWNFNIDTCRYMTEDQMLRLDLSTAVSIVDENSTTTVAAQTKENALFQVVAAAGSALEGSVFEQIVDSVDTASTAERFQWAAEELGGAEYYELTSSYFNTIRNNATPGEEDKDVEDKLKALILTEGVARVNGDCSDDRFAGKTDYLCWVTAGYAHIKEYLDAGYDVISVNDEFLGPGYEYGLKKVLGTISGTDYTWTFREKTRQRGAAFIAVKKDASGNIVDLAHVVTGLDDKYKGGGAASPEDSENAFDPAKAADILKDEFEDKSIVHGVDLASGNASWSSGNILSVGNGGFPYELSLEMKIVNNQEVSPNPAQQHWRYGIFEDNIKAEATMSGSGLEAMGASHPWNAVGSLVAFEVAFDAAKSGDLSGHVLLPLVNHWWRQQMFHNVVTFSGSAGGTQFVRLPDGSFNAPAGSSASMTLACSDGTNGVCEPVAVRDYNHSRSPTAQLGLHQRWTYGNITYEMTMGDTSELTFAPTAHMASDDERTKQVHKHFITGWTTPNDFGVTYSYDTGTRDRGIRISSITNDFSKSLTFNYGAVATDVTPDSISNGTNAVTFGSFGGLQGFSDPQGGIYTFETATETDLPANARQRPGFQLKTIYVPEVGAALRYTYDEELRVRTVEDAIAIQGGRTPYEFFIAQGFRGERVDPLGNSYTAWYGLTDDASHTLTNYQTLGSDGTLGAAANKTLDVKGYGLFEDEMGREVRTDFDAWGRVTARTYPDGRKQVFTHDDHSNMLSIWKFSQTGTAATTLKAYAAYDTAIDKPLQVMDFRGFVTTLSYDANGNVERAQRPSVGGVRPTFHYRYNDDGQLTRVIDAECMVTTNSYFTIGTDAGYLQQTVVDDALDEAVGTCAVKAAGEAIATSFGYDAVGNQDEVTDPLNHTTTSIYDGMRRPTRVTDALGNYTITDYDFLGRAEETRQYDAADTFLMGGHKEYTKTGQVRFEYGPRCFDETGTFSATRSACTRTEYTYTALDQVDVVMDAEGRRTNTNYATDGQVTELYRAWGSTDQILYQKVFYENSTGRKVGVEDANGNRTTYAYDIHSRLMQTTFPSTVKGSGTTNAADYEEYSYDDNGNMEEKRTRNGDYVLNGYDALNRLSTKTVYHKTDSVTSRLAILGTTPENTVTYSYDKMGRDVCISQTGGTTVDGHAIPGHALYYVYDSAGRLDHERQGATGCTDAGGFIVDVGHDKAGNRTSLTLPGGGARNVASKTITFSYDDLNRMHQVKEGTSALATYGYDAMSRRTGVAFLNGQSTTISYFGHTADGYVDGAPKSLAHAFTAGQNVTYSFGYNLVNQITSRSLSNPAYMFRSFEDNPTKDYLVNGLNQYTEITTSDTEGTQTDYKAPLYTDNGSLDTYGAWDYDYDAENRLVHAEKTVGSTVEVEADYGYDPKGRRIVKAVKEGTTDAVYSHFLYEGDEPIADLMGASAIASNNPMTAHYLHGANVDERLVTWSYKQQVDPGEDLLEAQFFYHADHQGSIVALSNGLSGYKVNPESEPVPLGAQVALYNYDAYGNLKKGAGDDQPFLYTGRRYDAETGLYYYRARYYSAELGRFLQTDPIGYEDNMNLYGYTNNDPVNGTDPSGMCEFNCPTGNAEADKIIAAGNKAMADAAASVDAVDVLSGALIVADVILGGPTGEGIAPAAALQSGKQVVKSQKAKELGQELLSSVSDIAINAVLDQGATPTSDSSLPDPISVDDALNRDPLANTENVTLETRHEDFRDGNPLVEGHNKTRTDRHRAPSRGRAGRLLDQTEDFFKGLKEFLEDL